MTDLDIEMTTKTCGAQLRGKPGRFCRVTQVMPNGRCRLHGGATPRGIGSANLKDGRYSKDLPAKLLKTYNRARNDVELLNLGDDIALGQARISELLGKLSQQNTLLEAIQQVSRQVQKGETPEKTIAKIQSLTEELRLLDGSIWAELREQQEKKRKLVEAERRQLKDGALLVDIRQVILMITRFEQIVLETVTISSEKAAIGRQLQTLAKDSLSMTINQQEE